MKPGPQVGESSSAWFPAQDQDVLLNNSLKKEDKYLC